MPSSGSARMKLRMMGVERSVLLPLEAVRAGWRGSGAWVGQDRSFRAWAKALVQHWPFPQA